METFQNMWNISNIEETASHLIQFTYLNSQLKIDNLQKVSQFANNPNFIFYIPL